MKILHVISWSGGADSTVMLHKLINNELKDKDYRILFMDTSITIPATLEYIKQISEDWGLVDKIDIIHPESTFEELLKKFHIWPSIWRKWCRTYLKGHPVRKYYQEIYRGERKKVINHIGISVYDSHMRKKMYSQYEYVTDMRKYGYAWVEFNYPLLKWTDHQKSRYSNKNDIPKNLSYRIVGKSGCYFCPFYPLKYYKKLRGAYPDIFNHLACLEKEIGHYINYEFKLSWIASIPSMSQFMRQTETIKEHEK